MQVHFGCQAYRLFCAGCHGAAGRGGGPLAEALDVPISDLTRLAAENGGVFPSEAIREALSGRGLRAHLNLKIGPWAEMFADEFESFAAKAAAHQMVARRIDHIIVYLESIQR